ncbi:MAG: sulfite exporter TauE/SafE family protein [Calditrichia bacterium]
MTSIILFLVTIVAYFIKGLSGFGPAMVVVPMFTLFAGAPLALTASALLDAVSGIILIFSVWRKIDWRFVLPIIVAISLGSFFGAQLVFIIPLNALRKIIGIFLSLFIIYLLINPNSDNGAGKKRPSPWYTSLAGLLSGITGGLVGMSGPPLVSFMKYHFPKDFFRTQLIAIFLIEKFVRLAVYSNRQLLPLHQWPHLLIYIPFLLIGLWIGNHFHARISEKHFNRAVAVILIFPAVKLIFF